MDRWNRSVLISGLESFDQALNQGIIGEKVGRISPEMINAVIAYESGGSLPRECFEPDRYGWDELSWFGLIDKNQEAMIFAGFAGTANPQTLQEALATIVIDRQVGLFSSLVETQNIQLAGIDKAAGTVVAISYRCRSGESPRVGWINILVPAEVFNASGVSHRTEQLSWMRQFPTRLSYPFYTAGVVTDRMIRESGIVSLNGIATSLYDYHSGTKLSFERGDTALGCFGHEINTANNLVIFAIDTNKNRIFQVTVSSQLPTV